MEQSAQSKPQLENLCLRVTVQAISERIEAFKQEHGGYISALEMMEIDRQVTADICAGKLAAEKELIMEPILVAS